MQSSESDVFARIYIRLREFGIVILIYKVKDGYHLELYSSR